MRLQKLEPELLALTPNEKAQAIQILARSLGNSWRCNDRVVLTLNRRDFKRLHRSAPSHAGIMICTDDADRRGLARRINTAILAEEPIVGKLVSVVRPAK